MTKKNKADEDVPHTKPCTEYLKVQLTDAEVLGFGKDQGRAVQEKSHLEDQLKEVKDSFKSKISAEETAIKNLSNLITNGYQFRNVECEWRFDWDDNTKTLYRLDSFTVVRFKDITLEERQATFEVVPDE